MCVKCDVTLLHNSFTIIVHYWKWRSSLQGVQVKSPQCSWALFKCSETYHELISWGGRFNRFLRPLHGHPNTTESTNIEQCALACCCRVMMSLSKRPATWAADSRRFCNKSNLESFKDEGVPTEGKRINSNRFSLPQHREFIYNTAQQRWIWSHTAPPPDTQVTRVQWQCRSVTVTELSYLRPMRAVRNAHVAIYLRYLWTFYYKS